MERHQIKILASPLTTHVIVRKFCKCCFSSKTWIVIPHKVYVQSSITENTGYITVTRAQEYSGSQPKNGRTAFWELRPLHLVALPPLVFVYFLSCSPHHHIHIAGHRKEEGQRKHTLASEGMTRKLSLLLISHWPEASHVTPAGCKGSWEMFSLAGKQSSKLTLLVLWRLSRKRAEPAISTQSDVSYGINAPKMFSLNRLEGDQCERKRQVETFYQL